MTNWQCGKGYMGRMKLVFRKLEALSMWEKKKRKIYNNCFL